MKNKVTISQLRKTRWPLVLTHGERIIYSYRFVSLTATSLFFLVTDTMHSLPMKLFITLTLLLESLLLVMMYHLHQKNKLLVEALTLIDLAVVGTLLLSTGGFKSTFIGFASNPVLVAITLLNQFEPQSNRSERQLLDLQQKYENEKLINDKLHETMRQTTSLYNAAISVTMEGDINTFLQTFLYATTKLIDNSRIFIWIPQTDEIPEIYKVSDGNLSFTDSEIQGLQDIWNDNLLLNRGINEVSLVSHKYQIVVMGSSSVRYGLVGIEIPSEELSTFQSTNAPSITLLTEVACVILEQYRMQKVSRKLLISNEQNRIANELHDSVSQRLFSLTHAIHALENRWVKLSEEDLQRRFKGMTNNAREATQELRRLIYGLSNIDDPDFTLQSQLSNYLNGLQQLNEIRVRLNIYGDEDIMSLTDKGMIYRIIAEASGNAIRHGSCTDLKIEVEFSHRTHIKIVDNGVGLNPTELSQEKVTGLGLRNIQLLVNKMHGKLHINSTLGQGTEIDIVFVGSSANVTEGVAL